MAVDVAEVIRGELLRGEKLLWSGRPSQGLQLSASDWFTVPFSLVWCAFVGTWLLPASRTRGSPVDLLFGVLFAAYGLYMLVGRFFVDAAARARTFYGLTATRVVIVSGLLTRTVHSVDLAATHDLVRRERADGTGSISFVDLSIFQKVSLQRHQALPNPPTLDGIPDVRALYNRIRELQTAARAPMRLPTGSE